MVNNSIKLVGFAGIIILINTIPHLTQEPVNVTPFFNVMCSDMSKLLFSFYDRLYEAVKSWIVDEKGKEQIISQNTIEQYILAIRQKEELIICGNV